MSSLINQATIKERRDTAGNWTSNNPTPLEGQDCLETDTGYKKIGDGSTAWTSLEYVAGGKQLCKAWVNFDGTTNVGGKCTIADSYNVTDVDDNGVGDHTINFTNAMTNANYSCVVTREGASVSAATAYQNATVNDIDVLIYSGGAAFDSPSVSVQIFGT